MAKTEHSKNFAKVEKYYKAGAWNLARVRNAVSNPASNPWITPEEYEENMGQPYELAGDEA